MYSIKPLTDERRVFYRLTGNAPVDPVTGMPNWQSKMVIPFVYADKFMQCFYLSSELKIENLMLIFTILQPGSVK